MPDLDGPALRELVATVSHELRQPLASIRGFTEMMLAHWEQFSEQEKRQMLGQVLHDAKRLGALVDELLHGDSPLQLRLGPTDVRTLIELGVRNLEPVFPHMRATLDLAGDLPVVVADGYRLEQVLGNIIENACKYGSPGAIAITARSSATGSSATGSSAASDGGGEVTVTVADTGPGIAAEQLGNVTDKSFRSAEAGAAGEGLGLWIAKRIVEAHGGCLEVASIPGQGTCVSFTIPVRAGGRTGKLSRT